jgi:hypothetical protein
MTPGERSQFETTFDVNIQLLFGVSKLWDSKRAFTN